jgi:hypothetical protein
VQLNRNSAVNVALRNWRAAPLNCNAVLARAALARQIPINEKALME